MTLATTWPRVSDMDYEGRRIAEWRQAGQRRLGEQWLRAGRFDAYYNGARGIGAISGDSRDIFVALFPMARTNWAELVINAVNERLRVEDFRFGESTARARMIWQASKMDAISNMVQRDGLVCGSTFVSVWPSDDSPAGVEIVAEHPSQVTILYRRGRGQARAVAAYKRESAYEAEGVGGGEIVEQLITREAIYTWYGSRTEPDEVEPNPSGEVLFVELAPQPNTMPPPRSELHSVTAIQDRINLQLYNRLVASDFGAFRQITATGVALERGPDGEYRPPFNVGADRLLASENEGARISAIPESELNGYLRAVEADVQHLAATTQTPPHYLLGQMINLSADALKAAEVGLVSKVNQRMLHFGEAWEQVLRLALRVIGDVAGAEMVDAETVWADPETRSEGQRVDALVKMATLGVPQEVLWQKWGESPQEIERWRALQASEGVAAATRTAAALGAVDPYAQLLSGARAAQGGGPGGLGG